MNDAETKQKASSTPEKTPDSKIGVYPSAKKGCLGVDRLVDVDGKRVFGKETVLSSKKNRRHGVGIWGNRRVVLSFECDEGLKKQFLSFSKRVFGSVCLPMESLMAGILSTVVESEKFGVYPSSTVPLKFEVGRIVIERNLRPRRKLEFKEDFDETKPKCHYCELDAVGDFCYCKTGKVFPLCSFHVAEFLNQGMWEEVVEDE